MRSIRTRPRPSARAAALLALACATFRNTGNAADPPPPPGAQPRAVCPAPSFDWGTVFAGQEVAHTYVIRNEGTAPLRILGAPQTTCRCTAADYTEVIAPGEEGFVKLRVDTGDFKGRTVKKATIRTNDPGGKPVELTFGGVVRDLLTFTPLIPTLRGVIGADPARASVTLKTATDIPLESLAIVSESAHISATLVEVKAGAEYRVDMTTAPELALENLSEPLKLEALANGDRVAITIPVHVTLKNRIDTAPRYVIFRHVDTERWLKDPASLPPRIITVTAAEGVTFSIEKIVTLGGFFRAEVIEPKDKNVYQVAISLSARPEGTAQPARGTLEIHTSDPFDRKIERQIMAFFPVAK